MTEDPESSIQHQESGCQHQHQEWRNTQPLMGGRRVFSTGRSWPALLLLAVLPSLARGGEGTLLDSFDAVGKWRPLSGKPTPELSSVKDGRAGGAVRFTFFESSQAQFAGRAVQTEGWDQARGLSFWFKGDGSASFVALELLDEGYTQRHAALISLSSTEWRRVALAWEDFVPETITGDWWGSGGARFTPSGVKALWFGRWFYLKPWSACTFEVDELRLEEQLERPPAPRPAEGGLPRTLAKLRAKEPLRIVALGDSITYGTHLTRREAEDYPARLQALLRERFGYEGVAVANRGQGGLETRQAIALLRALLAGEPPDLVTAHFGYNDFSSMREHRFTPEARQKTAARDARELVQRIRVLTGGRSEVLLIATIPGGDPERRSAMDFFGTAGREAAAELGCGFTDAPRAAFQQALAAGKPEDVFVRLPDGKLDVAHPNAAGQQLFAAALLKVFE
jgi:lysophospholipase L1-like esterase